MTSHSDIDPSLRFSFLLLDVDLWPRTPGSFARVSFWAYYLPIPLPFFLVINTSFLSFFPHIQYNMSLFWNEIEMYHKIECCLSLGRIKHCQGHGPAANIWILNEMLTVRLCLCWCCKHRHQHKKAARDRHIF
jgi:hypothetical protein